MTSKITDREEKLKKLRNAMKKTIRRRYSAARKIQAAQKGKLDRNKARQKKLEQYKMGKRNLREQNYYGKYYENIYSTKGKRLKKTY